MGWLSVPSFIKNRRKSLAVIAGTVGTGYLITKWAVGQFQAMAASSAKGAIEYANLQRRFSSAQADAEFTVLALLPTLGEQVNRMHDLEGASKELSSLVRREREEKAEKERRESEREERAKAAEARRVGSGALPVAQEQPTEDRAIATSTAPAADQVEGGLTASMVEEGVNLSASVTGSSPLNPTAPPFKPPAPKATANSTSYASDPPSTSDTSAPPFEAADSAASDAPAPPSPDTAATAPAGSPNGAMSASLSKSWAQVVVEGSGEAKEAVPVIEKEASAVNGDVAPVAPANEPSAAGPTKAELWQQIKVLSFTRTLTTLYLISLLTLQTHVQLSLLGRASYVAAVVAGLPASDSPTSSQTDLLNASAEDDLEMASLAREIDVAHREGGQAEVERLYLSVSWWLLHEGAREVGERVRGAVEEVVGPLALKSTITYSALPGLLAQVRHRVEFDPRSPDARTSFLSALLPPTSKDLATTLASSAAPSSPASPPSPPPHKPPPPSALLRLLDETADLLASADGRLVQRLVMDRLVAHLVENVEPAFQPPAGGAMNANGTGSRFEDVGEREVRLASLLPVVARQGVVALSSNPNGYVERAEEVRELHEFGAVVFGGWDREAQVGQER